MSAKGEAAKAYLLRGDDEFQKHQELEKLLKLLVSDDFADFDLERLEGDSSTCDQIVAGLNVPPFGSGRRVVLVRYANKINADEQEKLATRLQKTPASGCLILVNPAAEKSDGKPKRGSEVIGELSRAVRKVGEVKEIGGGRPKDLAVKAKEFAGSRFATAGKKIDGGAIALFVQRVGLDYAVIDTESRKLIDYSGDREQITSADVSLVTSETPEEKVFKMVDAVAARNAGAAMRLLDELFESGDDPRGEAPRALAMIARQFRFVWQMRMLQEAGVTQFNKASVPEALKTALPSDTNVLDLIARQDWQRDRLGRQARGFKHVDLARCFTAIAKADAMLKGVEGDIEDARLIMELLVMELARP